jgi:ParB-like chromosome segregation protein Spo0J
MRYSANLDPPDGESGIDGAMIRGLSPCAEIVELPISVLRPAEVCPRISGLDENHIRALAESASALPPIIVHRTTMRVVDGWHRVHAARLRGTTTIAAAFCDGEPAEVFVLAVRLNAAHGLPLSLADRKVAAQRILLAYPDWSDRSIARIAGISHRTVAAVRSRSTGEIVQSTARMARNGVLHRPRGQGRHHAAELFAADPAVSARTVAEAAGISLTTAKDVRKRLRAGERPPGNAVISESVSAVGPAAHDRASTPEPGDVDEVLPRLRRDPSLRFTDAGRKLLRWLENPFEHADDINSMVGSLPAHCLPSVAGIARQRAREWEQLARLLDQGE